jgi:hypothetical protein
MADIKPSAIVDLAKKGIKKGKLGADDADEIIDKLKKLKDGDLDEQIQSGGSLLGDLACTVAKSKSPLGAAASIPCAAIKGAELVDEKGGQFLDKTGLGNEGIGGDKALGSQAARWLFEKRYGSVLAESRQTRSYPATNGQVYRNGKLVTPAADATESAPLEAGTDEEAMAE